MPIRTLDTVRSEITRQRDSDLKWREVGNTFPGVPLGTLCRIYKDSTYIPHKPEIIKSLGLPITAPAPVCPKCGGVHVTKRCTANKPAPRKRRDWRGLALLLAGLIVNNRL